VAHGNTFKKEFVNKVETGLFANQDYTKYRYRFTMQDKEYSKTFNIKASFGLRDRKRLAKKEAEDYRNEIEESLYNLFTKSTKVDNIAQMYFDKKCKDSSWTRDRKNMYINYIKPVIGKKAVGKVIEHDILTIVENMRDGGKTKQNEAGNSHRNIVKCLRQVLKPILEYAMVNGAINKLPPIEIPKKETSSKKFVSKPIDKLKILYHTIIDLYKDEPFYRALFLFALFGRRWNEIRTLKWEHINFNDNVYTIAAEHNKIGIDQYYDIPLVIREALLEFMDIGNSIVFASPQTGKLLSSPRWQLDKIKEVTGIEELTMHYFRHILVSALGSAGVPAQVLSASLGHQHSGTVTSYYQTVDHLSHSQSANQGVLNLTKSD
jgi:integrase